jgi:maltose phosphorylase
MAKEAIKYYKVDEWKIIEEGFDPKRGRPSESIFSLGNEYMGTRGQFDETYSGDKLLGTYFNGVFEEKPISHPELFRGLSTRCCFMINANNWLYTKFFWMMKSLTWQK